jgi:hypothetical protein
MKSPLAPGPGGGLFSLRPALPAILVVFCALAVHLTALGNGFHYDDGHSIVRNPHIRNLGNLSEVFTDPAMYSQTPEYAMFRPLVVVSTALNYHTSTLFSDPPGGGYQPSGYLLVNLAIHLANSLLVLSIISQLTASQSIIVFGAIAFSLHPLHTEVINYASARSESLAALFYLAAACCYLRTRLRADSKVWLAASPILFACSLLTKEIAVTLPIALLALDLYVERDSLRGQRGLQLFRSIAPTLKRLPIFVGVLLLYLIVYQQVNNTDLVSTLGPDDAVRSWDSQLGTQSKAIIHYILAAVFPVRMSVYPQFQESPSVVGLAPLLGVSLVTTLYFGAWRLRRVVPAATLGVGWFLIALLPTNIVPLHVLVNDHRTYLSLFGFTLAFVRAGGSLPPSLDSVGLVRIDGLARPSTGRRLEERSVALARCCTPRPAGARGPFQSRPRLPCCRQPGRG